MASASQSADFEFSVLTFNVHCTSIEESTKGITEDQVQGIKSILKETEKCPNLLIHAQDKIYGQKRDTFKTTLKLDDVPDFNITDNETAGIFLDNRKGKKCEGSFLTAEADLPHYPDLKDRLSAFKLKMNKTDSTDNTNVLLVSYHGPNSDSKKSQCLTELIEWIKSLCTDKSRHYDGAVVAGDFNLTMEKAKEILTEHDLQFVPGDTRFRKSIDFAIIFGQDNIQVVGSPEVLRLSGDWDNPKLVEGYTPTTNVTVELERSCKAVQPFDHPRVLFHFKLVSKVDKVTKDFKKLSVRKTKTK